MVVYAVFGLFGGVICFCSDKSALPLVPECVVNRVDSANSVYSGPAIALWLALAVKIIQMAMVLFWPRAAEETSV